MTNYPVCAVPNQTQNKVKELCGARRQGYICILLMKQKGSTNNNSLWISITLLVLFSQGKTPLRKCSIYLWKCHKLLAEPFLQLKVCKASLTQRIWDRLTVKDAGDYWSVCTKYMCCCIFALLRSPVSIISTCICSLKWYTHTKSS